MMDRCRSRPPVCRRYQRAAEQLGRRWSAAVIRATMEGPARFTEIRSSVDGLSARLLAERLRELETAGLMERRERGGGVVEYRLTPKGEALSRVVRLVPVLDPRLDLADDPRERLALGGKAVLDDPAAALAALHQAGGLELAQALGEQAGREPVDRAADLGEARRPLHRRPDHRGAPAAAEQLGRALVAAADRGAVAA